MKIYMQQKKMYIFVYNIQKMPLDTSSLPSSSGLSDQSEQNVSDSLPVNPKKRSSSSSSITIGGEHDHNPNEEGNQRSLWSSSSSIFP